MKEAQLISELAEQAGIIKENNRIAKAILEGGFSPEIMEKLYKIISAMPDRSNPTP